MVDRPGSNMVRGTVDLMVLRCLREGPAHGLAIARWIRDGSEDVVSFEDAALYQSLHRLERRGMVTSSWGRSDTNRRARFYELTARGGKRLKDEAREFHALTRAIGQLLDVGRGKV